ncbi:MAG: hypothetical protein E6H53_14770, partial [Betaproteobacteria bacterium]
MRRVIHADRACGAGLVLDDHRLPPELGELLREDPRHEVGASGRRIGDDQVDRLRWVGFPEYRVTHQCGDQSDDKDEWSDDTHTYLLALRPSAGADAWLRNDITRICARGRRDKLSAAIARISPIYNNVCVTRAHSQPRRLRCWRLAAVSVALLCIPAVPGPSEAQAIPARCRYVQLAKLPITYARQQPIIEGTINGTPVKMLLDTGAQQTVLTRDLAEKLGLTLSHSSRVVAGISGVSTQYRAQVDNMSIGPIHGNHVSLMVAWETANLPSAALVGADFVFQHDIEISLSSREIKFFEALES